MTTKPTRDAVRRTFPLKWRPQWASRWLGEAAKSAPRSVPPAPEPLARLLREVASLWASEGVRARDPSRLDDQIDTPEAAAAFAAEHNLDIVLETRKAASLQPTDLPAVVMIRGGLARLIVGRRGQVFEARAAGGAYEIDGAALADDEAGSIFMVRSRTSDAIALDESSSKLEYEADPTRGVMSYMLTRQRPMLVQLLLAAAFSNIMLLALPVYTGLVYDRVIPHSAFDTLWAVSIGVTLALIGDLVMRGVRLKLQDALAGAASAAFQASIVRSLFEVRMSDAPRSAATVTMRLREIDGLTQIAPMFLAGIIVDAPFLALVFILIWVDGGPVLFAPIFGLTSLAAIHHFTSHAAKADQARTTRLMQLQTNRMIEAIEGLETVKTTRTERRMLGRFERIFDEFAYSAHVAKLWNGVATYANITIGQFMVVLVMLIGVYQISAGSMTMGGLSSCSLLVGRIINPIGQLIVVIHKMYQTQAVLKTLSDGVPGRAEDKGDVSGVLGAPRRGAIRLDRVSFAYPGQTSPQLHDVSCSIQPGERVAIIGRSGSGKTTLLRLLVRLLEPDRGSILVDEVEARQYAPSDLRRSFGYMSQSTGLFDESLMANLTLGCEAADPVRIEAIAKLTGVADFAGRHPKGYAMALGPRGEKLSGGERQSTTLARVLIAQPQVLILDEPTAAMDTMLEARFVREFPAHLVDRTLIVATHRAPILDLVDRLIWLDAGRVIADGPKAEVLRRMAGAVG